VLAESEYADRNLDIMYNMFENSRDILRLYLLPR